MVLDSDGAGVAGRHVTVNGTAAPTCGSGCYRARAGDGPLHVGVDARTVTFALPVRAADATPLLRRLTRTYRSLHTTVFDEHLASSPTNGATSRFRVVAPDRLAYDTKNGPSGIVIGARRWDRERRGARWVESPQTRIEPMQPYWGNPTNVHVIAPDTLAFLDRRVPAWFRVTVARDRMTRVQMTAAAHFMVDRYVGFNGPVVISPPLSR